MLSSRKKAIRIKADDFRANCKVSRYGIIDLFQDCTRAGYKVIRYPLSEDADLGFCLRKEEDIIVFTNSNVRLSREYFTLAHEIGHIILHLPSEGTYVDNSITLSDSSDDGKESEANYFAACLLLPEDDILRFLDLETNYKKGGGREHSLSSADIARIMSEFKVSFDMTLNRLESLLIISASQKTALENAKNEKRVGNLLRSVGGNAGLNIPSRVTAIPYEYLGYVIYNYNQGAVPIGTLNKVLGYYHLTMDDIRDQIVQPVRSDDEISLEELVGGLKD